MRVRVASLGSGSRGNATVVASGASCVLVDCGFSLRETTRRLARLGLAPGDLDAILVTHEHSDHATGVGALSRRHGIPVYASHGTVA
ncbi:MAG TPA: MBL fold metallo-hydrolase, partial [Pseudohaliea sp.]|nr:MBL fold metallo-hydrolase [Pseudohaliea sp.]